MQLRYDKQQRCISDGSRAEKLKVRALTAYVYSKGQLSPYLLIYHCDIMAEKVRQLSESSTLERTNHISGSHNLISSSQRHVSGNEFGKHIQI